MTRRDSPPKCNHVRVEEQVVLVLVLVEVWLPTWIAIPSKRRVVVLLMIQKMWWLMTKCQEWYPRVPSTFCSAAVAVVVDAATKGPFGTRCGTTHTGAHSTSTGRWGWGYW